MYKTQAAIAAVMLALSGCAAIQGQMTTDSEQILAQAGFHRESVSSQGATSAAAQNLKVRQLTAETQNGTTTYEFYDPQFCHCVYVGGTKEYAELQRLRQPAFDACEGDVSLGQGRDHLREGGFGHSSLLSHKT